MHDLAIIGAGWAGFNAMIRARERGLSVCLIDSGQLGGTCLNQGCIPTKALIQSAKVYSLTQKSHVFGVQVQFPVVDFAKVQERKAAVVKQLQAGMRFVLKDVELIKGRAEFVSPLELRVDGQALKARNILIAVGSAPAPLTGFPFDGKRILSSDDMLNLPAVPVSLLIIGGGVIGCEFASLYAALGCRVTIVEKMAQLLPGEDKDAARKLENTFTKKGITVLNNSDASTVNMQDFEKVLVSVGRNPCTGGLNLESMGVQLDKGKITVDEYMRTRAPSIFAAGDCTGMIMLAHYAAHQGRVAADNVAIPAHPVKTQTACVPNCIFTDPEIASVGLHEEKARAIGRDVAVHKFEFLASGMARILDETDGFIKIVAERSSGVVLGAVIIGPRATELIGILTLAVSASMTIQQLRNAIFAHPTLSESVGEAARS